MKETFGADGFRPGATGSHGEAGEPGEDDHVGILERLRPRLASVRAGTAARRALSEGDLDAAERLLGAVPPRERGGLKKRVEAGREDARAEERLRMVLARNRLRRGLRGGR